MSHIAEIQERKEAEIDALYAHSPQKGVGLNETEAATAIQRTYRGHRARRELAGLSLDPSTRWVEAIKEARWRQLTTPRPRSSTAQTIASRNTTHLSSTGAALESSPSIVSSHPTSPSRQQWRRINSIVARANADDRDDSLSSDLDSTSDDTIPPIQREALRKQRIEERKIREKSALKMDLQYFLEMVDRKHRYGSSLRKYHAVWKSSESEENFFYWLDKGEGQRVSLEKCPRERLDRERVRYLSREERLRYLVMVDREGRLCWRKNGVRITTDSERWRDSVEGIVEVGSPVEKWEESKHQQGSEDEDSEGLSGGEDKNSNDSAELATIASNGSPAPIPESQNGSTKPKKKSVAVPPAKIFSRLLKSRPSSKPNGSPANADENDKNLHPKGHDVNKWIFVADTSFNLFVGIKQSGAFQHSSFLHGSRISAAGLIRIKDGQIKLIEPRSGHYRPPASNFVAFINTLKARHVDMSSLAIGKSYAILGAVQGYHGAKETWKGLREKTREVVGMEKKWDLEDHGEGKKGHDDRSSKSGLEKGVEGLNIGGDNIGK